MYVRNTRLANTTHKPYIYYCIPSGIGKSTLSWSVKHIVKINSSWWQLYVNSDFENSDHKSDVDNVNATFRMIKTKLWLVKIPDGNTCRLQQWGLKITYLKDVHEGQQTTQKVLCLRNVNQDSKQYTGGKERTCVFSGIP